MTWIFQPFWKSIDNVQKTPDFANPAKNRRKMNVIDLNWPGEFHYTHCLFFVKCKCPNGYSVVLHSTMRTIPFWNICPQFHERWSAIRIFNIIKKVLLFYEPWKLLELMKIQIQVNETFDSIAHICIVATTYYCFLSNFI